MAPSLLWAALFIGASALSEAQAPALSGVAEEAVKAEFLYRFAGYIEWPATTVRESNFTIEVIGSAPVAGALQRIVAAHPLPSMAARVRLLTRVEDIGSPQILYLGDLRPGLMRRAVAAASGRPVLVVSDTPGGLDFGSTLNFLLIDRRIRFEVSLPAAHAAGLKISAELLAVAVRVQGLQARSERHSASAAAAGT